MTVDRQITKEFAEAMVGDETAKILKGVFVERRSKEHCIVDIAGARVVTYFQGVLPPPGTDVWIIASGTRLIVLGAATMVSTEVVKRCADSLHHP
jgi:hypothetical protein